MPIRDIRLPALSATMEEATLIDWLVAPGETVNEGQAIAEVSTDKVDMEMECPYAGTLVELRAAPGGVIALGAVMATIETEHDDFLGDLTVAIVDDGASQAPATEATVSVAGSDTPATSTVGAPQTGGIVPASPPARKLAKRLGIDLHVVTATGVRGQVTPADVQRHADAVSQSSNPTPEGVAMPVGDGATSDAAARTRRATARIMTTSAAIPQFTLWRDLDLDRRAVVKGGVSWTSIMVAGLATALSTHPQLNRHWDDEREDLVPFPGARVGLAVDRPGVGLVVAGVSTDGVDLAGLDRRVRDAIDRARAGNLRPDDLAQASITLSNLGGMGVDRFNALLFPPQAAILSVGSIAVRPTATADRSLRTALTCTVGLTVDHRVADGADGARFLGSFAEAVEGTDDTPWKPG